MLLLGLDLGTSSVKVSVIDASNGKVMATAQHPEHYFSPAGLGRAVAKSVVA